jgi:hypothetical protein
MSKSVIILVYSLAPKNGVGARRWRKYALALANNGTEVYIVGANNSLNEYLKHDLIKYLTFDSNYPKVLDCVPSSILSKINYHFNLYKQKLNTKGAIYDRGALDKKAIISLVSNIIDGNKVKNLIVSGAPFSLLYYGTIIKTKYQSINLISDFRDAWTWGEGYGIQLLNDNKKKQEEFQEQEVISKSDIVTVASEDLKIVLESKYHNYNKKLKVLLNGIEFDNEIKRLKTNSSKIIITHIGSVNLGTEKYWVPFLNIISTYEEDFVLRFIGGNNASLKKYVQQNQISNVEFIGKVKETELEFYFQDSNYVLMFKKNGFENTFPTKYFDYIKHERFILAFTKEGSVSRELEDNNIGKVFNESVSSEELVSFIKANKDHVFNQKYNKFKFSIEGLTKFIDSLLQ